MWIGVENGHWGVPKSRIKFLVIWIGLSIRDCLVGLFGRFFTVVWFGLWTRRGSVRGSCVGPTKKMKNNRNLPFCILALCSIPTTAYSIPISRTYCVHTWVSVYVTLCSLFFSTTVLNIDTKGNFQTDIVILVFVPIYESIQIPSHEKTTLILRYFKKLV